MNNQINLNEEELKLSPSQQSISNTISPELKLETLFGEVIIDKRVGSLSRECCHFMPSLNSIKPAVLAFEINKSDGTDFKLKKTYLEESNVKVHNIGIPLTMDVIDDLKAYTGSLDVIKNMIEVTMDLNENNSFFEFLDSNCKQKEPFYIDNDMMGNMMSLSNSLLSRIQKEIIYMNLESFKGLEAFCIISPKHIQKIGYLLDSVDSWIALGKKNNITFYVNPLKMDDKVYIGLKGFTMQSSSIIFSPISTAVNNGPHMHYDGNMQINIMHKYGYILNPLKDKENLLAVFDIVDNPKGNNPGVNK